MRALRDLRLTLPLFLFSPSVSSDVVTHCSCWALLLTPLVTQISLHSFPNEQLSCLQSETGPCLLLPGETKGDGSVKLREGPSLPLCTPSAVMDVGRQIKVLSLDKGGGKWKTADV